jgi:molecular chaperone GrpE (heat shock protein)
MSANATPTLAKWPFLLGDLLFVGLAALIVQMSVHPLALWQIAACVVCLSLGAWLAVLPFLKEYEAALRLAETASLTDAVAQIQNLESVASQVGGATTQLQIAQEAATKTVEAAQEIATRMTTEAAGFAEFMQKANDSEKGHLRLEVEKLRRAEGDWLQILIRLLDHVFALYQAGARSGQPALAKQLGHFQDACRDAARRVGLVPFIAPPGEPFDPERHQLPEGQPAPGDVAFIADTLATGYTFQGQPLRRALVALVENQAAEPTEAPAEAPTEDPAAAESPSAREPRLL